MKQKSIRSASTERGGYSSADDRARRLVRLRKRLPVLSLPPSNWAGRRVGRSKFQLLTSNMEPVYILGGGRTDFKRNLKKEGKTIRNLITEAGKKALDDAKIDPAEIQAGAVGNFNAGQFTKQLHLGAFIPEIDPKLHGIPTMHTEAACASGALSVLLGAHWIMGGFHDAVLVVGAEQQKTMSSLDGSDVLGAAADYHIEKPGNGDFMFPKLFGRT